MFLQNRKQSLLLFQLFQKDLYLINFPETLEYFLGLVINHLPWMKAQVIVYKLYECTINSFTTSLMLKIVSLYLEASSPVDPEKKTFARLKEEIGNLGGKSKNEKSRAKKEKPPKKLTKSKSTEQQPQATPSFGTTVSNLQFSYYCRFLSVAL